MKIWYVSTMSALVLTMIFVSTSYSGTSIVDAAKDNKADAVDSLAVDKSSSDNGYFKKPDWLNEVSVTFKEGFDSNIYLINNYYQYSNKGSFFTSVTPKFELNLVPLLELGKGDESIKTFTASYAPEFVVYHGAESEDYTAHRINTKLNGAVDDFSYGLDNGFTYIQGRGEALSFGAPYNSYTEVNAYSAASYRERLDQIQDKLKLFVREDMDDLFVRPVANAIYYDMLVTQQFVPSTPQYLNFPDRYDANTGVDLGYKVTKDYDVFIGYRYGHQFQGALCNSIDYTCDYQRVVVGIEGKPYKWMTVNLEMGPDFRNYGGASQSATNLTGVTNSDFSQMNKTVPYFDGGATFDITSVDSLILKAKQWQWMSSVGLATYTDRDFSVTYRRKITDELSGTAGFRYQEAKYDAPNTMDDIPYSVNAGLQYKLDEHWTFNTDYSYTWCGTDSIEANRQGSTYYEQLITASVKWSL